MIRPTLCRFFHTSAYTAIKPCNGLFSTCISRNALNRADLATSRQFSVVNRRCFGSYIEDYYTTNHASTGFSSPLRTSFSFLVIFSQFIMTFGYWLHTNYYFTGKAIPKADGQTQLCSDSR
ncbi:conserved hypothetical protein [Theileria orientalis strain Shintoku]|uniref:Uncharacterized protein n=1 Tax=Theileria orientalis strain Shintoku TaxID=869250 RepID=J4D5N2_THEOR|nr:conserved hypothetical protein [Theileria orientalis strain Shintoku]BAM39070.1 conserved hypothetical protein [Theileria orientalis strain Shintoku]|eukprot:XP_009689371.1 conserved hypothetical protein [Theileria orientalis strain Shintoku]